MESWDRDGKTTTRSLNHAPIKNIQQGKVEEGRGLMGHYHPVLSRCTTSRPRGSVTFDLVNVECPLCMLHSILSQDPITSLIFTSSCQRDCLIRVCATFRLLFGMGWGNVGPIASVWWTGVHCFTRGLGGLDPKCSPGYFLRPRLQHPNPTIRLLGEWCVPSSWSNRCPPQIELHHATTILVMFPVSNNSDACYIHGTKSNQTNFSSSLSLFTLISMGEKHREKGSIMHRHGRPSHLPHKFFSIRPIDVNCPYSIDMSSRWTT